MAGLTTHVLDTANGRPAEGVRVELYSVEDGAPARLLTSKGRSNWGRAGWMATQSGARLPGNGVATQRSRMIQCTASSRQQTRTPH